MNTPSRRDLFKTGASLAALGALGPLSGPVLAAMGPNDKFDLLIRNANALDAGSGLAGDSVLFSSLIMFNIVG